MLKKILSMTLTIALFVCMSLTTYNAVSVFEDTEENDEIISSNEIVNQKYTYDPDGILERADFDTDDEYDKYITNLSTDYNLGKSVSVQSVKANNSVNLTAQKKYTLKNLAVNNTIQNFRVGTKYIYTTQKHRASKDDVFDIYISRCKILSDNKTAVFQDKMVLKNFGHDQILSSYFYNDKLYFWIGCKANTAYPNSWFTTQIGRIQYQAGKTYTNYNQICRFGNLNYANKDCKSIGAVKRIDAVLSTDKSKLLLAVRSYEKKDGKLVDKTIAYSCYNNTKLNKELDKVEKNTSTNLVIFKDNETLKKACYFTVKQNGSNNFILPNKSCQGLEFTNDYTIYISGGALTSTPKIAKLVKKGNKYIYSNCATLTNSNFTSTTEIEGLQQFGNKLYFGITGIKGASTTQYIYSIEKSKI